MKNLFDLTLESGPRKRLKVKQLGGGTSAHTPGAESFLDKALDRKFNCRITDKEFAERVWKICIKRRAPDKVLSAIAEWRHLLEYRERLDKELSGEKGER